MSQDDGNAMDRGRVALDTLVEKEIMKRMQTRNWGQLEMCFRWRLLSLFIEENGLLSTFPEDEQKEMVRGLRERVRRNQILDVEYDCALMKITGVSDIWARSAVATETIK